MVRLNWGLAASLALVAALLLVPSPARAEREVGVALVLAVDVSRSMDPEEQELQREGFVEAFRSPLVHEAIRSGTLGRMAVIYMEWSGVHDQKVVVPWMVIEGPEGALEFSERLAQTPISRIFQTSISGAIDFSVSLLTQSGVEPLRQVIDISGDGPDNSGRTVTLARDEAVAKGITINGLPIMLKRPSGFGDMEDLDLYFRECVIGGPGAFIVPVRERHQFTEAIRAKLVREIAGLRSGTLIQRVQDEPRVNCLISRNWDYWRN